MAEDEVKAVRRAIAILRCFTVEESELGVSELARKLDIHKSTISRLLSTLESEGLVNRNIENRRYSLGMGLLGLASHVVLHTDLRQTARPLLRRLANQTQETVDLAIRDGDKVVNIEQITPSDRLVLNFGWVGRRSPMHASSTGKVLLAHMAEEELDNLLKEPLDSFTDYTITDPHVLRAELALVKQNGYATGFEILEIGLNAVAAPIRDHTEQVIATCSVAGPSYRFSKHQIEEKVAEQVIECASSISRALGYS
ncbi:MAG: IclR family transcriptional regulator [Anaerolineales bacterium]|nr:IclR family transcriptional regulator [Anaerolineales bacterium]